MMKKVTILLIGVMLASTGTALASVLPISAERYIECFAGAEEDESGSDEDGHANGTVEFDHADIFDDLAMIQRQFHHLVRIVPGNGLIVHPSDDEALQEVLGMGCWTPLETFGPDGYW